MSANEKCKHRGEIETRSESSVSRTLSGGKEERRKGGRRGGWEKVVSTEREQTKRGEGGKMCTKRRGIHPGE